MDRPFRAFQMIPKGHLKAKVMALLLSGQWWAYLSIGTTGLGAAVKMLRSIFTFLTLKWFLKGQPRSKVIADSEPLGLISHLCSIVTIGLYLAPFRRNSPIPADRRRRQTDRQQCCIRAAFYQLQNAAHKQSLLVVFHLLGRCVCGS